MLDLPKMFKPFVAPNQQVREFTPKSIILGILFGLLFGASTVYLGLKIGLTVSASIPIAVLSIAIFKKLGNSTILENNIVQTTGSAGESIASGVTFTIPALIFLGYQMEYPLTLTLAVIGGTLGVLFMIPLRRYLIVKEHGKLPYPEGTACADVLIAGEKGGKLAKLVFSGLGFSVFYKFLMNIMGFWKETPHLALNWMRGAVVSAEITPELLGVGYIIGPRISGYTAAGGALAWLVLMPVISFFGQYTSQPIAPATKLISAMSMGEIWSNYIRYIGGGTVVFGGIITLIKSFPTIWNSFSQGFKDFKLSKSGQADTKLRTDKDLPIMVTVVGALGMMVIISLLPFLPGAKLSHIIAAVLIVILGFFFCTVSSRIVGLIGSSANPISGMTITTLMLTCLIFVMFGWKGKEFAVVALSVGTIVCIAAANAGNTSQDLKTGYIVGATPYKQQLTLIIGVLTSCLVIGLTMIGLHKAGLATGGGIGSEALPAPKGQLMALIIDGVLSQAMPWDLVLFGIFIGLVVYLCGVEVLPFAVGVYLPFSISLSMLIGGLIHALVKKAGEKTDGSEETSPGVLYSSGLIAGGAVMGIVYSFLKGFGPDLFKVLNVGPGWNLGEAQGGLGDLIAAVMFVFMGITLYQTARRK
ncbi:MAG: oligopeptide transporter, OPT family [Deltaproteobacteria bacterium RIFCSPLOWO2_12_FULL_44_12]|nr:MAG: oligopeptide transporter, OPT family [Deltaproteobacteria bacterium RIFCSPHIGHO2_01_FULL_43_49]OGQ15730.1 MAG: oligopeptide transporter, OPT family [Deltaproteobacteria bacterium RIFCSPHIGHO2_02_FULL_44_53]OGQ28699.1 MAG: oligopeptide transporter, OPT family [Deltaproteobacteria bacterium RIFCSPHIGHO2_12_FULL_44_21]OGQ32022.1 MAG: oligopeptide transporter, OPT family [Deltaproteobacteria bacterium RIFCSPLOWO2_01_FULL_45_74]OGQ43635.1 MAG: oligopeptide transporter, OPT family [Deltaprote